MTYNFNSGAEMPYFVERVLIMKAARKTVLARVICLTLTAVSLFRMPLTAEADVLLKESAEKDSLSYFLFEDHAKVVGYFGEADSVVIPAEVEGVPVTEIAGYESDISGASMPPFFFAGANLTDIVIPDSVTNIGRCAFQGTAWLESKKKESPLVITNGILVDGTACSGKVVIPDGVKSIAPGAFESESAFGQSQCNITSIVIPNGVTTIGKEAFKGCSRLTNIEIPESVTKIGDYAFEGTPWFDAKKRESTPVMVNGISVDNWFLFDGSKYSGDVVIPDGVTDIRGNTGGYGITNISLPDSLKNIGENAFVNCSDLTSIAIPDGVTGIGDAAFMNCAGLTNIKIPDSVKSIGQFAFTGCENLKEIELPDSITSIEYCTFSYCPNLTGITIPDCVTSVGARAFDSCRNLSSIQFPERVSCVGESVFFGCENLTRITFLNPDCKIYLGTISEGFSGIICGYDNSTAESYAKENNYTFESLGTAPEPAAMQGDFNGDGLVSVEDAQLTLRAYTEHVAGLESKLTEAQKQAADINGDGEVSVEDAQLILRYYTEKTVAGKDITWDDLLKQ